MGSLGGKPNALALCLSNQTLGVFWQKQPSRDQLVSCAPDRRDVGFRVRVAFFDREALISCLESFLFCASKRDEAAL